MKSFINLAFVAATVLLLPSSVWAQDAAAPIRRISPPPSPTVAPTPVSTPVPPPPPAPTPLPSVTESAPKASPSPEVDGNGSPTEASPAATRKPSGERKVPGEGTAPSRRVLREKPVRALEPGRPFISRVPARNYNGPRASRPTFDLSESSWVTAGTLRSHENRWEAAIKNHDTKALDELLSDNFEGTSATGGEASKERMLALLRRDTNTYKSARAQGMSVRSTGEDTAVVTGKSTQRGVTADGGKFAVVRNFTDTWKQRKGVWRCVASRVTTLPKR